MQYFNANFITSAINKSQWPDHLLKEVVLAGRSNVGKSSLINSLCNRKNLAYTGNTPGKTRLLNFYNVDDKIVLVDVPGYGYAARSSNELNTFGEMMETYFNERDNLKALILIVDMRHKPTKDDIEMLEYAKSKKINTFVVATKFDKVKSSERDKQSKLICDTLGISNLIHYSSVTKKGQDILWDKLNNL